MEGSMKSSEDFMKLPKGSLKIPGIVKFPEGSRTVVGKLFSLFILVTFRFFAAQHRAVDLQKEFFSD